MEPATDIDLDLDLELDVDLDSLSTGGIDFSFFEPLAENESSPGPSSERGSVLSAADNKPYHSKRPHKKSRAGCKQCKTRKVKVSLFFPDYPVVKIPRTYIIHCKV